MAVSLLFLLEAFMWGSALGLMSMGLTLTYLTTKVPNFAHATVAMTGMLAAFITVDRWFYQEEPSYAVFAVACVLGFILAGIAGLVLYVFILKPLQARGNDLIGLMIATFAYDILLMSVLTIVFTSFPKLHIPKWLGADIMGRQPTLHIGGYVIYSSRILLPIVAAILAAIFHLFLTKTKFGIAMRATIENPSLAETLGINTNLVYLVSWFISGGLAGIAGVFVTFSLPKADVNASALIIVSVFAGSIVGGLSSVYWGLIGGLIVGFSEKIIPQLLIAITGIGGLTAYERLVSLGLVIIVLLFAPQGLAGVEWRRFWRR